MKKLRKTRVFTTLGGAALAALVSLPAAAVEWQAGDWTASYSGFINLFASVSERGGTDSFTFNEGLLPSFHTMKVTSPTVNGLTGTSQITFAVDNNDPKGENLNKGDNIDVREVFFNVEGSFGTVSVGRGLSLFQRQAILKDMTLFGVGAGAGDNRGNGTSLGRIGHGYVYPDFNTRVAWKLPTMGGFSAEFGIFQPKTASGHQIVGGQQAAVEFGTLNSYDTEMPQFQAELTYNTEYQGGNFGMWVGGIYQSLSNNSSASDLDVLGYNVGVDFTYAGFNLVGSYYGGDGIGTIFGLYESFGCSLADCTEASNDGYYVQSSYTFNGVTKVGVSYGETTQDADAAFVIAEVRNTLFTVGVYHDVNDWLKVIAEYNINDGLGLGNDANKVMSVGGFIFW